MAANSRFYFLFGIVLFSFSVNLNAQYAHELRGFDQKVFEYHFDRADRELEPESWLREARKGVGYGIAAWERAVWELYADPALAMEAMRELERWSEAELERRYAQWLFNRFFGKETGQTAYTMDEAVEQANRLYAFHTDADGNVLYDETGNPDSVRPYEGRSVEDDLLLWNQFISHAGESELYDYELSLAAAFPELLSFVNGGNSAENTAVKERLLETVNQAVISRHSEFEALLSREERLFTARRTGDIYSLRKESENESASAISSRLIRDAENYCASGIAALEEQIEAARADPENRLPAGEEWIAVFEEQFEKGLKAWSEAEERFIVRRMEWERDSGERFEEGENAWKTAFAEMEKQRLAWEDNVHELFNAGERLFANTSEKLSTVIAGAKEEFQREAALRVSGGKDRAEAIAETYLTCVSVMTEARESVDFWLSRFVSGAPGGSLENGTLTAWVRQILNEDEKKAGDGFRNTDDPEKTEVLLNDRQKTAAGELIRWAGLYTQYRIKAREALTVMEKEFGLALGMDGKALNSVLGSSSEDFFLDEYQIELLRAKAVAGYWEQRLSIAEAVSAYVEDISAGRMTEAESLRQWRESKERYDGVLEAYEAIQKKLKSAGLELSSVQKELRNTSALLLAEEQKLEALNNRYSLQMAAYQTNSGEYIRKELDLYCETLTKLITKRESDNAYYTAWLKAEQKYLEEYELSEGWALLKNIVQSEAAEDEKKTQLAALNDKYSPELRRGTVIRAWRSLINSFDEFTGGNNETVPDAGLFADELIRYSEEKGLSPAFACASLMLSIDEKMETPPAMAEGKIDAWKEAFITYMAAKVFYSGIVIPEETAESLEKYEKYAEEAIQRYSNGEDYKVIAKKASFYHYLLKFLTARDTYTESTSSEKDKKHWRSYTGNLTYEESLLADAYDMVKGAARKMTEAFELMMNGETSDRYMEFINTAAAYLANPNKAWEARPEDYEFSIAEEIFLKESEKQKGDSEYEESLKREIADLGFEYNHLPPLGQAALNELRNIAREQERAKITHQNAFTAYQLSAEKFHEEGRQYEKVYAETKRLFENVERARIAYEKADAIQRWAATAYLSNSSELSQDIQFYREPAEELAYAKERNDRAQIALSALASLYKNNESSRPYANETYQKIYEQYRESFSRMFLTLKAKTEFAAVLEKEQKINRDLYFQLSSITSSFLSPALLDYYDEYTPPALSNCSWLDFVKITDSGDLGISRDKGFRLRQISKEDAENISRYLKNRPFGEDRANQMSEFEKSLAAWSDRMKSYNLENNFFYQFWGLALDYIIRNITANNPGIEKIAQSYTLTEMGADGTIKLDGTSLNGILYEYRKGMLEGLQTTAWNTLTDQQQKDLEFLAALFLTGGGGRGIAGLDSISPYFEMYWLYLKADYYVTEIDLWFTTVTAYRWPYTFDHSELNQVLHTSANRFFLFKNIIDVNRKIFSSEISEYSSKAKEYNESSQRLSSLSIRRENGISWADIETVLTGLSNTEMSRLHSYWNEMLSYKKGIGENPRYITVDSALDALYTWGKGIRDKIGRELEETYFNNQGERQINQVSYRSALDDFINGEISLDELHKAAKPAYGRETASLKRHLYNVGTVMISDLKEVNAGKADYLNQYRELANQYTALIERAYNARFSAELSAREVYWNEQRKDLNNKLASWREASSLILERGRQDWKDGKETMLAGFNQWNKDFSEQYNNVDAAWNAAYLESLTSKENWINQVLTAASESLDSNLLRMAGTDAESFGRKLDSFMPSSFPGQNTTEEAGELLRQILNSAGIAKIHGAFSVFAGNAATVSTTVKSGVSGLGLWDSGQAQLIARDFAQTSTNDLADGKMKILAFQARESVYDAKKSLNETIAQNNKDIDSKVDELYILSGGWARFGNNYIKEIIVHSTFFRSAITDKVVLNAYRFFVLDYWDLTTDLSDENIGNLNYLAVQGIIARAEKEITEKSQQVFGDDNSEGEFGAWVGKAPVNEYDMGTGELGRLIYGFTIWENRQSEGITAMHAPLWDKPLWDSRGSWFNAPSLRSAVDTMTSIAAAVVGAVLAPVSAGGSLALAYGISMTDDLIFNSLDVANGYKDWGEFGAVMGKTALINAATTAGKIVFNGLGQTLGVGTKFAGLTSKVVSSAGKIGPKGVIASKTFMSGVEALSTSTVTSAVSAISYNNGKLGWDWNSFKSGMKGGLVNAAVAGTNIITTETMNLGLGGFYDKYYSDGVKLSSLAGGLAGQGVHYAFGGDFTLNAVNLSSFNQYMEGHGLVELSFGRDGFSGNFGTGGLDVSLGTLAGAFRGLEAWKVNLDILASGSESARNYASQMRTLYSSGDTGKNLYDSILANETMILEDRNVEYTRTTYDPVIGKTIVLGNDAINDESRFGLNVVFGHEAYRNGIDDGVAGQRQETDMAVMGHVSTALGLKQTYGEGVLGEGMTLEAKTLADNYDTLMSGTASEQKKMEALAGLGAVLGSYDSSGDYWRMQHNGTLVSDGSGWLRDENGHYINDDGTRTLTPTEQTIGSWDAKKGLLNIMFGGNKFSKEQVTVAENILKSAGLAANGTGRKGVKLGMDFVMFHAGDTVSDEVFRAYYNNTMDYNIANVYKVDLIFNKKGNWHPNKVYSNSSERYTQLLREKYDAYSRNELIDLLKDKYLQTMVTDEGKVINMLKNSTDNPYISMLQNQNSIAFSNPNSPYYNYELWQWGCNFMTTIAIPQLLTGNVLSAREVTDVWNWAISTRNPLNKTEPYNYVVTGPGNLAGLVNNTDMLANHVLQDVFGYQYHSLTFNYNSLQRPENTGATNFVAVKEQYDPTHFFLDNTKLEKIYDPWPYINRPHMRYDGVFLDIRGRSGNGYYY